MTNAARKLDPETTSSSSSREGRGLVPVEEAARILGVSTATVSRRALELGAKRGRKKRWLFDPVALQAARERAAAEAAGKPQSSHSHSANREQWEGERDARVVSALEGGRRVAQIVESEKIPLETVLRIRATWVQANTADRQGVEFRCECGAPSSPRTARCDRCAPRTRTLTPAQIALLAGEELPPPGVCACSGCGAQHRVEDVERLCSECQKSSVGIVIANGRAEITLRLSSGKLLSLRPLSAEEVAAVARFAAPQVPRAPQGADASVTLPETGEPLKKGAAIRSVEAVMQHASVGLSRLDELLEQERARSKSEKA
jgi:hypothetical protein